MGNFLKNLQMLCTTAFMATVLAVNVSAAIPEENILMEIDEDGFVSDGTESYNWAEDWNTDNPTMTGEVNYIKEGTTVKFSLTEPIEGNAVLNSFIYKLDGNTITHISDGAGAIIQRGLSTDTPVEITFSKEELSDTVDFMASDESYIKDNQFSTNYLYVFTVDDWEDDDINREVPVCFFRIEGEETAAEVESTPATEAVPAEEVTPATEIIPAEEVTPTAAETTPVGKKALATPHAVPISLTENATTMRAYSIDNTDYFSLRDIASLLNGTGQQFDIQYDKATKMVTLTTQKPYALVNMDYTNSDGMTQKEVTSTAVTLNVDGQNVSSVAYNINGTNYFSIADLNKFIAIAD